MKSKQILVLLLLLASRSFSQNWFNDRFGHYFRDGGDDLNKVVDTLKTILSESRNRPAPNILFHRLEDGSPDSLGAFLGTPLVLSLWQTTCPPCVREMPDFTRARSEFSVQGLEILYVSNVPEDVQIDFFKKRDSIVSGIKAIIDDSDFRAPFQCIIMPSTFLIDKKGVIRDAWLGRMPYDTLKARIDRMFTLKQ